MVKKTKGSPSILITPDMSTDIIMAKLENQPKTYRDAAVSRGQRGETVQVQTDTQGEGLGQEIDRGQSGGGNTGGNKGPETGEGNKPELESRKNVDKSTEDVDHDTGEKKDKSEAVSSGTASDDDVDQSDVAQGNESKEKVGTSKKQKKQPGKKVKPRKQTKKASVASDDTAIPDEKGEKSKEKAGTTVSSDSDDDSPTSQGRVSKRRRDRRKARIQ